MRVLTWNLWWRFGPWEQRRHAIRQVLRTAGADVLGLQEVWAAGGRNLAGELADELGMHWAWSPSPVGQRSPEGAEIGNAILSRWPIAASRHQELPAGALGDGRTVLFCRIEAPFASVPFFTTQLSSPPAASALRCAQVTEVSRFVADNARTGFPPVVTGDLNAEPDADEIRLLCGHKTAPAVPGLVLIDAWRYADPAACGDTWDRRNPFVRATHEPRARIDYILVGVPGPGGIGHVVDAFRTGDAPVDGVWASDHAAVAADLASS